MFKFLFGGKSASPSVTVETDRLRFERLVAELNQMIDGLGEKPRVTIDPATGHVLPETPEQFPDEALALPAPEKEQAPEAEAEADAEAEPAAESDAAPEATAEETREKSAEKA